MKTANQISMNEKQAITCRRLSRVMLWLSTVFLIILQVMGFFVAVNAGYEKSLALALSFVPVLGPFYCVVELFSSGAGEPVIIIVLSVPVFANLLGFIYFRNQYKRSLAPADIEPWDGSFDNPADLSGQGEPDIRPSVEIEPFIPAQNKETGDLTAAAVQPEPERVETAGDEIKDRLDLDSLFEKYEIPDISDKAEGSRPDRQNDTEIDSEYKELLNDVLSILEKNKSFMR